MLELGIYIDIVRITDQNVDNLEIQIAESYKLANTQRERFTKSLQETENALNKYLLAH